MNRTISIIFILVSLVLMACGKEELPETATEQDSERVALAVALAPANLPIYRRYNASVRDHLYSAAKPEGAGGYSYEGLAFVLFQPGSGRVPLYRCYSPSLADHFASRSPNCEGNNVEGVLGYIYPSERPQPAGTVALYRLALNPLTPGVGCASMFFPFSCNHSLDMRQSDHVLTVNTSERSRLLSTPGWRDEGVVGYVRYDSSAVAAYQ